MSDPKAMVAPDWSFILGRSRGVGKTHEMAEAAKRLKATLVCLNQREAERVRRAYDVPTLSIQEPDRHRGMTGPVLFDPDAVGLMASDYEQELQRTIDASRNLQLETVAKFRAQLATARNEALEEAAKVCDELSTRLYDEGEEWKSFGADECVTAVRALKLSPA